MNVMVKYYRCLIIKIALNEVLGKSKTKDNKTKPFI